jgi:catechol 2,3-dioxygenase-like lactoylglutathione lyase family enzyme
MLSQARVGATIPTKDLARARAFYEEKLNISKADKQMDSSGVLYQVKDGAFFVYQTEASGGEATRLSFVVDDFDAEMAELRERGIVFEEYDMPGLKTVNGVVDFNGTKGAFFKDPDGNVLSLTSM